MSHPRCAHRRQVRVGLTAPSGALLRRFIPDGSGAMDARLAAVEADGTVTWLHTNHQGSVVATSNASGAVRGWASYSPSGELAASLTAPPPAACPPTTPSTSGR